MDVSYREIMSVLVGTEHGMLVCCKNERNAARICCVTDSVRRTVYSVVYST